MPAIRCGSRAQVSLDTARLKLLFDQNLAPRLVGKPKVVWVRLGNCTTDDVVGLLELRDRRLLEFDDQPEVAFLASLTAGAPPTTVARLALDALQRRDYTPVSGINLVFATAVVLANLLVDLSYAFLDPRVRYR